MKKNKSTDQSAAQFNNNPFKSLKSFKSRGDSKPGPVKKTPVPAQKENRQDDLDMFLRAVSGVREIDPSSDDQQTKREKNKSNNPSCGEDREDQQLFVEAMQKIGATFRNEQQKPDLDEAPRQSSSSRMRQLKRGTIRIREELDLHGYLKAEALVKLAHFIAAAYNRGQKAVLVITGKGNNSPEGPVLQGAVASWLYQEGKGLVAEFAPAPRDMGGSGAFVVFLKNRQT